MQNWNGDGELWSDEHPLPLTRLMVAIRFVPACEERFQHAVARLAMSSMEYKETSWGWVETVVRDTDFAIELASRRPEADLVCCPDLTYAYTDHWAAIQLSS